MSSVFPKWTNQLPTMLALGAAGTVGLVIVVVWHYFTPGFWEVGYMPTQPGGGFNHMIHAGKLGMDCRYCHTKVEVSAEANVPNVATCMGCHTEGRLTTEIENRVGPKVEFLRVAYENDASVAWRRIHKLPDYVRNFPHHVHLNAGVSCYSCHGQIAKMPVVSQDQPISMAWCLDCHRDHGEMGVTNHIVDKDKVTDLFWVQGEVQSRLAGEHAGVGEKLLEQLRAREGDLQLLPTNCGACHY